MDKFGNMIGSLFIGTTNLALALVEEGLASVHPTCSDRTFMQAEKIAKTNKLNVIYEFRFSTIDHLACVIYERGNIVSIFRSGRTLKKRRRIRTKMTSKSASSITKT